ncbi:MAG: hypothetical protein Q9187_003611 [Circinaria calcarea]
MSPVHRGIAPLGLKKFKRLTAHCRIAVVWGVAGLSLTGLMGQLTSPQRKRIEPKRFDQRESLVPIHVVKALPIPLVRRDGHGVFLSPNADQNVDEGERFPHLELYFATALAGSRRD